MKVLIINSWEKTGGAAIAANRLHKALLKAGVESVMLVMKKDSDDNTVVSPFSFLEIEYNKLLPTISVLPLLKYNKTRKKTLFSPHFMAKDLSKIINEIDPDIVHIHWINAGFMSLKTLLKIDKPIVWSLHDMWLFTGGCHYSDSCVKFTQQCGHCTILGGSKFNDLSYEIWNKKNNIFQNCNMVINGLSKWIMNNAKKSSLLKNKTHINLPNLIDTDLYRIFDKTIAKKIWNLPSDKKLILFGAMHATSDKRKGYQELKNALSFIQKNQNFELVIFGSSNSETISDYFYTHFIGRLNDDISLMLLYNAVDVMVVPSKQENLSNVIMESLSCGTPVVAFDIGGNSDMIDHKLNGYLAKPYDPKDLANGVEWILNNKDYEQISHNARKKVVKNFSEEVVVKKYIKLYKNLL